MVWYISVPSTPYNEFEVCNDFRLQDNDPIDKDEDFTDNCHECEHKRDDLGFFMTNLQLTLSKENKALSQARISVSDST